MKARVTGEAYTLQQLWRTAKHFLHEGQKEREGSFYPLLAATLFASISLEALLNELIRAIAPDTYADERKFFSSGAYRGTLGKLHFVADRVEHPLDRSQRPYQTVKALQNARNRLAHARTETFDEIVLVEEVHSFTRRETELDTYASEEFVRTSLQDMEQLCDSLVKRVRSRYGDISVGSAAGAFSGVDGAWQASLETDTSTDA